MPVMEGMEFLQELLGDIEGTGGASCENCGSEQFFSEFGFYFCSICSTQSQQAREYIEAEDFEAGRVNPRSAAVLREKKGRRRRGQGESQKRVLSNWEVFNCTLKAMTDRLIELGFPKTFKPKVFTLWTSFLIRRRVISLFESEEYDDYHCKSGEPHLNKYALMGILRMKTPAKRKVIEKTTEDVGMVSVSQFKKRRSTAKKTALEKDYIEHASQMSAVDTAYQDLHLKPTEKVDPTPSSPVVNFPFKLSQSCKDFIHKILDPTHPDYHTTLTFLKPEIFSFKTLLSLLFISLRQVGCSILYTDVIRMILDGTLFVSSINLLLSGSSSEKIDLNGDLFLQLRTISFKTINDESAFIDQLLAYTGLPHFNYPSIREFLPKFIDDFSLPRELECLIYQMERMLPIAEQMKTTVQKQYKAIIEFYLLGSIITVLKVLFGLDDITEKFQSKFARTVNKLMEKEAASQGICLTDTPETEWVHLFVIEDWFEYIRYREEVVKSELLCPTMYSPSKLPSLNRLNDLVDRFTGQKGDRHNDGGTELLRTTTRNMFRSFVEKDVDEIRQTPNYVGIGLPKENVIHQFLQNHPIVNYPNYKPNKLKSNFIRKRIDFVYNPEKYVRMLEKAGYKVRVINGDARSYNPRTENDDQEILLFQPFKLFDDFIGSVDVCPTSLDFILNVCTTIISGSQIHNGSKMQLKTIVRQLGEAYCYRCNTGIVPLYPYSETSDSSDTESELNSS